MKIRMLAMATTAVGAVAVAGTGLAQNVPAQFVVSGPTAEKIQDFTTINLATAQRIAEACEAQAATGTVVIWDNDGNDVYVDRMDGELYINFITGEMKARTALAERAASTVRLNEALADPMQAELQSYQLGEFPNNGGLPIVVNKQMIGVIGVGGAQGLPGQTGFNDEVCAHKALLQVIGPSVAPLIPPLPRDQRAPQIPTREKEKVIAPKFEETMAPKSTLPAEWVESGKSAEHQHDTTEISLAAAKSVAKGCRDWAAARNLTASIYVLNDFGETVHMERMDGQVYNNIRIALMKGKAALEIREPTSIRDAGIRNNPSGAPRSEIWLNLYSTPGGIPIVVDGQMIGAIGVEGIEGGNNNEDCAVAGLKAAFGDRVAVPVYPPKAG